MTKEEIQELHKANLEEVKSMHTKQMKRPDLEQDYVWDKSAGEYRHSKTNSDYDSDLEKYIDYLEGRINNTKNN